MVHDYRDARDAAEALRESERGYQLEDEDFRAAFHPITFRAWLEGMRAW